MLPELLSLDAEFIRSIPRFCTPIMLAALGGAICHRAGIFNIALEGMMLMGAFAGVVISYLAGSSLVGVTGAMSAGALLGLLFAFFHLRQRADSIIVSIAINLLAAGLTAFFLRLALKTSGTFDHPNIVGLWRIDIPGLVGLPVIGSLFRGQTLVVWFALLAGVMLHIFLNRHRIGLRLRGVGEAEHAGRAQGVSIDGIKTAALVLCGALCGLGGAQLSLGNVTLFVENMSAGRGWIAVVAVMLAGGRPLGVIGITVIFGLVDSYSFRLQGLNLPQQFTDMLPYLITLAILIWASWKQRQQQA